MAQRVEVVLVDDLDGSEADETVFFALDGVSYEIDLSEKNVAALEKALAPFLAGGRRIGRARQARSSVSSSASSASDRDYDPSVVRAWAKRQGLEVSQRGRVSKELVEQWRKAG